MSEPDNLDSLSNAEIRAKCLESGLPNVPVTDSSRKVLIKKLRVSLGGGSNSPAASSQKKSGVRRETVHAAKQLLPEKAGTDAIDAEHKDSPRSKGRRTVAATPLSDDGKSKESSPAPSGISERRRSVREQVLTKTSSEERPQPSLTEIAEETEIVQHSARTQPRVATELNVQRQQVSRIPQRREEVAQQQETAKPKYLKTADTKQRLTARYYLESDDVEVVDQPKRTPDPIVERRQSVEQHAHITQRRNSNPLEPPVRQNTLLHNSLIVLESDDEDDEELVRVAEMAENQQRGEGPTRQLSSLSSLSSSAYRASELYTKSQYGSRFAKNKSEPLSDPPLSELAKHTPSFYGGSLYSSAALSSSTGRAPPPTRSGFLVNAAISAASSPYGSQRSSMPPCGNEQSDDPDAEQSEGEALSTPYLSSFARNLERLKAEPLSGSFTGSGTPHYRRTVGAVGGQYEPGIRRPLRGNDGDVSGAFRRLWYSLDNQYKLKWKLIGLLAIIFVVLVFVILF